MLEMGRALVIVTACIARTLMRARRDRVITTAPPWMTAENPANSEPRAFEWSVGFHSLEKIVRTTRRVAAAGSRSGGELEHRIEDPLVKTDHHADDCRERSGHHGFVPGFPKRPRRRAWRSQSASSSAKLACEAPDRAMVTKKRLVSVKEGAWACTKARKRRRSRLRSCALPQRRVVINPVRRTSKDESAKVLKMTNRPAFARPVVLTRRKSARLVMLFFRDNRMAGMRVASLGKREAKISCAAWCDA